MEDGLLKKTGKPLAHWIKVARASGETKHKAMIDFLKAEHGLTYGYANFIAHKSKGSDAESADDADLVAAQYAKKPDLVPLYKKLDAAIKKLGKEVQVVPKRGSVSYVRGRQFALIKPATKTRIDLGLKLPGKPTTKRLGDSGPFGTMCTHRVQLTEVGEVDKELVAWLKAAYVAAAKD